MTQNLDRLSAGLYVQADELQPIAFPLKHTRVEAKISGNVSRVQVIQTFENPFTKPLEAIYVFPLPDQAAVDDMTIYIGDRRIKGSIKPRQEAQQLYQQAKQQGHTAGLLEQERDNVFTQSLANLQPGEWIDVLIQYTDSLQWMGEGYEFVFPMVVGPRYIPGVTQEGTIGGSAKAPLHLNQNTDQVPDASRLNAPILPAGTRSPHEIEVTVKIDAGVEVKDVRSPSHQIHIERHEQAVWVKLADQDTIPNKDLILRYQLAGDRTQATVLSETDERGGHFAIYLIPANQYQPDQFIPKDVVFLIDTSGSQMGAPLVQCQELMRQFISALNPCDTFSIIDFSDTTQQLSPVPLSNTPQNCAIAMQYINQLTAGGGTEMLRGIRAVLNFPVTEPNRLRSIVLLTDGYIGNEDRILAEVQQHLKPGMRLHSFGAGSSVNRFLLNRIAEIGRGTSHIIRHDEPVHQSVKQFMRQVNHPVISNIHWHWEGEGHPPIIYPLQPPDLFAEQPLILFGRKQDGLPGKLHLSGTASENFFHTFELHFQPAADSSENDLKSGIPQLWGRARIKDLMNQMLRSESAVGVQAVTETALTYQLLSRYTAFVAIDETVQNQTQETISVRVPVEMPEAVQFQGFFSRLASPTPVRMAAPPAVKISSDSWKETLMFQSIALSAYDFADDLEEALQRDESDITVNDFSVVENLDDDFEDFVSDPLTPEKRRLLPNQLPTVRKQPLSAPSSPNSSQQSTEDAQSHFLQAQKYMSQARWHLAIEELRTALRIDPKCSEYHSYLAKCYLKNGCPTMAMIHIRQSLRLNPRNFMALELAQRLRIDIRNL